jgi:hypothetical protein
MRFSAVLARKLGVEEPATVMAFYQNLVFMLGAGIIAADFNLSGL